MAPSWPKESAIRFARRGLPRVTTAYLLLTVYSITTVYYSDENTLVLKQKVHKEIESADGMRRAVGPLSLYLYLLIPIPIP